MKIDPKNVLLCSQGLKDIGTELLEAGDTSKIDWSKLKPIFANLLQQFGPLLVQMLVSFLVPVSQEK